jgi:hypothetical protein
VGVGTDEGVGEVHACTNVVGSDGAPATVIAVVTQNMSLREILTALRSALVPEALRSGKATPDYLTVIEVRVALLLPKQDEVSEAAVFEKTTNNKALESTSPKATEAPDPGSVEPRPRPPQSLPPRRFPLLPLADAAGPWSVSPRRFPPLPPADAVDPLSLEPRPLTSPYAEMPNYLGADSESQGEVWQSARRAARTSKILHAPYSLSIVQRRGRIRYTYAGGRSSA